MAKTPNPKGLASARAAATVIAVATGSGAAVLGVRAGVRAIGAAAFAAIAGTQYMFGSKKAD